jgi:DNA-binding NarL/FixJ family response regulator
MRVVIGEDETFLRHGLAELLAGAGFDVVGVAADAPSVLELVARWQPDLLIIRMPPGNNGDGLQAATQGDNVLAHEVLEAMADQAVKVETEVERLTHRQREVLALLADGRSNAAIAARLMISERAVVQHTSRIYSQLGLWDDDNDHRRVLAALRYLDR